MRLIELCLASRVQSVSVNQQSTDGVVVAIHVSDRVFFCLLGVTHLISLAQPSPQLLAKFDTDLLLSR